MARPPSEVAVQSDHDPHGRAGARAPWARPARRWLHRRVSRRVSRRPHPRDDRPAGMVPGSRVYVGVPREEVVRFHVVRYTADGVEEEVCETVEEVTAARAEAGTAELLVLVTGLHEADKVGALLDAFEIDRLIQDDILNTRHRPKTENLETYLFVTAKEIVFDPVAKQIQIGHFAMIASPQGVLVFQEQPWSALDPVLQRIRTGGSGRIRRWGPDYLAWAVLDTLVDHYLIALDQLEADCDRFDDRLVESPEEVSTAQLHALRHDVMTVYRLMRPIREVVAPLLRRDIEFIKNPTLPFLNDLGDHAVHAVELAETLRDTVQALREFHLSAMSHRMNEAMKVLTSIATIFLPLTFVAGVYGMNFEFMPELGYAWAYPALWGVFVAVTLGLVIYFRRRHWL